MGLALVNLLIGVVVDRINYEAAMFFFVGADVLGVLSGVLLLIVDFRKGGDLQKVAQEEEKSMDEVTGKDNYSSVSSI